MLRVLTLSTLFPNRAAPTLGIFVERQTRMLAARDGVEVQVVSPVGLPPWPLSLHPHFAPRLALPKREIWNDLTVHRPRFTTLPVVSPARNARSMARALLPLLAAMRADFPFDVIDTEFFWPDGPAAIRLASALGVAVSIKARGADISYWGRKPGIGIQLVTASTAAEGLLAVSESLRAEMIALGMPEEKIRVHYTGVDLTQFVPAADRAAAKVALGISGPLILCVGALIERKGQGLALEALAQLPGATLSLAGDGPDRGTLMREAVRLDVADRTRFLGARSPDEIGRLLAAADLMMLPSRSEGLANAWVEAMACGTPVVTTDAGGAREAIPPEAGRIVARDGTALALAARDLLAEPPDPAVVRKAAERFSWDTNAAQLEAHLRTIRERFVSAGA